MFAVPPWHPEDLRSLIWGVIYWAITHLQTITHAGRRHCDLISAGERDMEGLLSNEAGGLMDGEVGEVLIQANILFSTLILCRQ